MSRLSAPGRAAPPTAAPVACAHCGLPVPAGLVEPDAEEQFCCPACRVVRETIRGCGLDRYYALREAAGAEPEPARTSGKAYEELDDPAFRRLFCRERGDGRLQVELLLEGVHCAACIWLIEKLPVLLPGVAETRVDFGRGTVEVVWNDERVALSRIARQLARLGYPAHPARGADARAVRRAEDRRWLVRIAVAGAIAGNVMLIAFALYGGAFHGIEAAYASLFRWISMILATIALLGPGRLFLRGAVGALRSGVMHMDVPVALGLTAGMTWSAVNTIRGAGEVYFESLTALIFLLLVGRWIQLRRQRRSADAIELLFSLTPATARLLEPGGAREVPVEALLPGQLVEVRGGDPIPVDGTIEAGSSHVDLALLTGESRPVAVDEGDAVSAGTTNLSGRLLVRAAASGTATRVGRLMRLVEEGARRRAPIVRLADRLAGIFVSIVVLLAAGTALVWWRLDPAQAIPNALALLIITCPCALGLATPLAVTSAIGRAARAGILIKGADVIERLRRPGLALLDKTGTITAGRLAVVEWHGPDELRPLVAALESASAHPIARALAAMNEDAAERAVEAQETTGGGIAGSVDGVSLAAGSRAFLAGLGIEIPAAFDVVATNMGARAVSPVFVARDGAVAAVAGLRDPVEPGASAAVAALRRFGWRVGVLSGDDPEVVRAIAAEAGIDPEACRGAVTPEAKLAAVEDAARREPVMMVGDGVNDAAALAAATVGVAVHGGAEASLAAADVSMSTPGLAGLPELLEGARRTFAVIRLNLALSLAYNITGASLAMSGVIDPLVAAILMPISSLTVITVSFRARTFGEAAEREQEAGSKVPTADS